MAGFIDVLECPKKMMTFKVFLHALWQVKGSIEREDNRILQSAIRVATALHAFEKSPAAESRRETRRKWRRVLIGRALGIDIERCRPLMSKRNEEGYLNELQSHIKRLRNHPTMTVNTKLTNILYGTCYIQLEEKYTQFMKDNRLRSIAIEVIMKGDIDPAKENPQGQQRPPADVDVTVIVAVDTNVLLHHRHQLCSALNNFDFGDSIEFYIPWIVHQELDGLKLSKDKYLAYLSRRAVNLLQDLTQSRWSQQIRRQSSTKWESAKDLFEANNNDDYVLQSCLQLRSLVGPSETVILWTEDKGLSNKCAANAVSTCNYATLKEKISHQMRVLELAHQPKTGGTTEPLLYQGVSIM